MALKPWFIHVWDMQKKTIYQKKGMQKTNLDFYKIYCIIIIMDFYSLKLKWSHIKLIKISKNRLDTTSMSFWILLNKRNPCFKIDLLKKLIKCIMCCNQLTKMTSNEKSPTIK
jgi:hypothetical protein